MINLLLGALNSSDKVPSLKIKGNVKYIVIMIITIIGVLFPFFFFPILRNTAWGLTLLIPAVVFFLNIYLWERHNGKIYLERLKNHNEQLNEVERILKEEFTIPGSNNEKGNWYSEQKINYLISSCEEYIDGQNQDKEKLVESCKTFILPIIAFAAGVYAEESSANDALAIALLATLVLVVIFSFGKFLSFIVDLVFKSSSVAEMKRLLFLLKELRARDF